MDRSRRSGARRDQGGGTRAGQRRGRPATRVRGSRGWHRDLVHDYGLALRAVARHPARDRRRSGVAVPARAAGRAARCCPSSPTSTRASATRPSSSPASTFGPGLVVLGRARLRRQPGRRGALLPRAAAAGAARALPPSSGRALGPAVSIVLTALVFAPRALRGAAVPRARRLRGRARLSSPGEPVASGPSIVAHMTFNTVTFIAIVVSR